MNCDRNLLKEINTKEQRRRESYELISPASLFLCVNLLSPSDLCDSVARWWYSEFPIPHFLFWVRYAQTDAVKPATKKAAQEAVRKLGTRLDQRESSRDSTNRKELCIGQYRALCDRSNPGALTRSKRMPNFLTASKSRRTPNFNSTFALVRTKNHMNN